MGPRGTGKTTELARYVRLAAEKYGSSGVIVTSFTKAAATEIAGRDLAIDKNQVPPLTMVGNFC